MNRIFELYSHISLALSSSCFVYTYTDIIVSKTIPTITMKLTDQNGLSLSLSSLLTPIVPLLSLSLALFYPFSSIIGCAHNLSTPLRLRINEWCERKKWTRKQQEILFDILSLFFLPSTYTWKEREREKGSSKKRNHMRACSVSCIQTIKFIYLCRSFSFLHSFLLLRCRVHWSSWQETDTGGGNMNERSLYRT